MVPVQQPPYRRPPPEFLNISWTCERCHEEVREDHVRVCEHPNGCIADIHTMVLYCPLCDQRVRLGLPKHYEERQGQVQLMELELTEELH